MGSMQTANQGDLNELWEFDPTTKQWSWMGGSSTVGNNGGQSGVYGVLGSAAAANVPGGRDSATSWIDKNGQFWLYGGEGLNSQGIYGQLNDLWVFDPATSEWTWKVGSSTLPVLCTSVTYYNGLCGWPAVYGTLGQSAPSTGPGSRVGATGWTDSNGNLWLFGGLGSVFWESRDFSLVDQYDLWEFNPSTKQWTWMSGNSTSTCGESSSEENWCAQVGNYGTQGTPAIANIPPSRSYANAWKDTGGNFWLFGGAQTATTNVYGDDLCDDIWVFEPPVSEWAWMNGAAQYGPYSCSFAYGTLGALGTPAAANTPSGRIGAASWTDRNGNLWLFGGDGWAEGLGLFDLNDLWVYQPVAPSAEPSFQVIASPNPITIGAVGAGNSTATTGTTTVNIIAAGGFDSPVTLTAAPGYSWAAISGSLSPATITGSGSSTLTISVTDAAFTVPQQIPLTVTATSGSTSQSIQVIVDVTQVETGSPTFSAPTGTYSTPQTVTISGANFIYYTTDGSTPTALLSRLRQSDYHSVDSNVESVCNGR